MFINNTSYVTQVFCKKTIICMSLKFLNIMLEISRFFKYFSSILYIFLSVIIDLVMFSTNDKHHFLANSLTRVSNFTIYICFTIVLINFITVSTMLTTCQHFHSWIFPCILKTIVLPIIMKIENNFK